MFMKFRTLKFHDYLLLILDLKYLNNSVFILVYIQ